MKFGLLYFKDTANIGDDIQTYAAKRFLPKVDYLVDREKLNCFVPEEKEYVSVIMNAWYMYNKSAWPPSPYINPLLISMHFTIDDVYDIGELYLEGEAAKYLNKKGPVGARDYNTKEVLERNGIDAYFSGCMTLTLPRFNDVKKQEYICAVDLEQEVIKKIKNNTSKEVRIITHNRNPEEMKVKSIDQRMSDVEKQLREYQAASLILTDRLHVALPALALGTPVILLRNKDKGSDRIKTFEEYVTHFQVDEFLSMNIKDLINNPKSNKDSYIQIRDSLIKKCEKFIEEANKDNDLEQLPDVEDYKKAINNIEWHNDLFYTMKQKLEKSIENGYYTVMNNWKEYQIELEKKEKIISDKNNEIEELKQNLKDLIQENKQNMEKLQSEKNRNDLIVKNNEELSLTLESIYNSRTWKVREKIKGIGKRK